MISCWSASAPQAKNFIPLKSLGPKAGDLLKKRTQPASPQASTTKPFSRNFFSMAGLIFSRT